MFEDISQKIKKLAVVITAIGTIVSVLNGFVLMSESVIAGLLFMVIGVFGSWASSFLIYGVGEIIEQLELSNNNTYVISKQLEKLLGEAGGKGSTAQSKAVPLENVASVSNVTEGWTCEKCGTVNENGATFCKDCGTYK